MQAPGEDAAGSPPSAARQDRKRSLQRHRGGLKHRKAPSKAPPPPSSAPCPFGCGCWFREKCSFCHPAEDIELWAKERAAKATLIDISATRKKARLEGRAARRSALSPLTNTATENTGAKKEEEKTQRPKTTEDPVARIAVQRAARPLPSSEESAAKHERHKAIVMATVQPTPDQLLGPPNQDVIRFQWATMFCQQLLTLWIHSAFFRSCPAEHVAWLSQSDAGKRLLQHGTGWCFFQVARFDENTRCHVRLLDKDNSKGFNSVLQNGLDFTLDHMLRGQVVRHED